MPDRFLSYLQQERRRLEQELDRVRVGAVSRHDGAMIDQLRKIVDDQIARWTADLAADRLAT